MKKLLSLVLIVSQLIGGNVQGAISEADRAIVQKDREVLGNPAFENGKAKWSVSTGSFSVTAGTIGDSYATWDAGAASETFMSSLETIPSKLQGENGIVECRIKTPSGTATHTLTVNDGTNDLVTPITIQSNSAKFASTSLNFVFPASGSIRAKIASVTNEPSIQIGRCSIRKADNVYEAPVVTNWETVTVTGSFTTNTTYTGKMRRVGDMAEIQYNLSFSGAPNATTLTLNFPTGIVPDLTKLVTSSETSTVDLGGGTARDNAAGSYKLNVMSLDSGGAFFYPLTNATPVNTVSQTSPFTFGAGDSIQIVVKIPVKGYSAISAQSADQTDYSDVPYTPIFTGFGSVSNIECFHSRVSDKLKIACKAVTGTPTATEARVSLPNSLVSGDTSKIPSIRRAGSGSENSTGASPIVGSTHSVLIEPSVSYVTFGFRNGSQGALTKVTGSGGFTGSTAFSFDAEIPIQGWKANGRAATLNGSVTSNAKNALRTEITTANCSTSSSVTSGDFLSSPSNISGGVCTYTMSSGWSSAPKCVFTTSQATATNVVFTGKATSATSLTAVCVAAGSACTGGTDFTVICMGPR